MLTDAHLHINAGTRLKLHPGIGKVFVNSISESDFDAVAIAYPNMAVPFFGFHPWSIAGGERLESLETKLKADSRAGVGECGLDFSSKYRKSRELQLLIFEKQLVMAYEYRRPISFHCVRAWGQLFDLLERFNPLPAPFIFHSFYGSAETAGIALKMGGYLSISKSSFMNPEKSCGIIEGIPIDRILIESDVTVGGPGYSPDDHFDLLTENYIKVARINHLSFEEAVKRINENGKIFTD